MQPSLERSFVRGPYNAPRIHLLEVRRRTEPTSQLAWIIVEIIEKRIIDEKGAAYEATLELACRSVSPEYDPPYSTISFAASYFQYLNAVKLTGLTLSGGGVFVDPKELRGHRVGTYLMDLVVNWARQWPEAIVQPISLLADQGRGEAGIRRNRFYEQFGLRFTYTSKTKAAGQSIPMPAGQLQQCRNWEQNIIVHELPTFLARQFEMIHHRAQKTEILRKVQSELIAEARWAQKRPFIWAIRQRWPIIWPWAMATAVVGLMARQVAALL